MTIETAMPTMTITELIAGIDGFDNCFPVDSDANFARGVDVADEMESVTIAVNNVWGGTSKNGGSVTSYEKIGYHAGSIDFIKGVLSTGCPVKVFRCGGDGISTFELEG